MFKCCVNESRGEGLECIQRVWSVSEGLECIQSSFECTRGSLECA